MLLLIDHEDVSGRPMSDLRSPDEPMPSCMSRHHRRIEASRRTHRMGARGPELTGRCRTVLAQHEEHESTHLEDMPGIHDPAWSEA